MPPVRDPMEKPEPLQRYEVRPGVVLKLSAKDAKAYPGARALAFGEAPSRAKASTTDEQPPQPAKVSRSSRAKSDDAPAPAPTKAELLARAAELGIDPASLGKKPKNADIAAAIATAEQGAGT